MTKSHFLTFTTTVALLCAAAANVSAITLTFDENTVPTNPINGFGSFSYDDFGAAGAITDGPTSLIFDITDANADGNLFGGIGVDYLLDDGTGNFVPQDFDASTHQWEMRVKILPNNVASVIRGNFVDDDGAGTADEYIYEFDLSSVPNDNEFHSIFVPLSSPLFSQPAFGFMPGDGVLNPGLRQIQMQSVFGATDPINIELDFLQIANVPEPGTAMISLVGLLGLLRLRRK